MQNDNLLMIYWVNVTVVMPISNAILNPKPLGNMTDENKKHWVINFILCLTPISIFKRVCEGVVAHIDTMAKGLRDKSVRALRSISNYSSIRSI